MPERVGCNEVLGRTLRLWMFMRRLRADTAPENTRLERGHSGAIAQDLDAVLAEPARDLCLGQALDMVEPRDPRAQLLCWSRTLGWQLRLGGRILVSTEGLDVTSRWARKLTVIDMASRKVVRQVNVGKSPHGVWTLDHAPR